MTVTMVAFGPGTLKGRVRVAGFFPDEGRASSRISSVSL